MRQQTNIILGFFTGVVSGIFLGMILAPSPDLKVKKKEKELDEAYLKLDKNLQNKIREIKNEITELVKNNNN